MGGRSHPLFSNKPMTPEEKRDRRKARHEVQAAFTKAPLPHLKLYSTNGQLRAAAKLMADRFFREQVRPAVERIESQVLLQDAVQRQQAEAQT
jgi:hypothetical protein